MRTSVLSVAGLVSSGSRWRKSPIIGATEAAILLSNVSRWIHGCCGRSIRDVAERGAESAVLECRDCSFLRRFAGFSADSGVSGPLAAASRRVFDWTGLVERI